MSIFNFMYFILMVFSIMYLFSSGKAYMEYAAKTAGRTHLEDKVQLSIMAGACFYGAFHPELSTWFTYLVVLPLSIHLLRIAYLSHKHNKRKL